MSRIHLSEALSMKQNEPMMVYLKKTKTLTVVLFLYKFLDEYANSQTFSENVFLEAE